MPHIPRTDTEVITIAKSRPNSDKIERGLLYESMLRVMTEVLFIEDLRQEFGYIKLLDIMRRQVHPNKQKAVLKYFGAPFPIVPITADIANDLNRVFDGRNANFNVHYPNEDVEERGNQLLARMDIRGFIERWGKEVIKNKPNSFVVVDKNLEGIPFLVLVHNSDLIGYRWLDFEHQRLDYIIFKHSEGTNLAGQKVKRWAFYDAHSYRVIEIVGSVFEVILDNPHNLGECPARPFLMQKLNSKSDFDRMNPFAPVITPMYRWQLFDFYFNYAEVFGVFPIMQKPVTVCGNKLCNDGIIRRPLEKGGFSESSCQECASAETTGPGSIIEIDHAENSDERDPRDIIKFISPPTESLKFETELQDKRERNIRTNTAGFAKPSERQPMNVEQIRAIMEGAKKPLLLLSMQLNVLHKWIVKTVIKLGLNTDVMVHANYGTEWFLLTQAEIQELFGNAKIVGLPASDIDDIYRMLVETKHKGNPDERRRAIILNNLEPLPYHNMKEAAELLALRGISQLDFTLKAQFISLVQDWERLNGSVVAFGELAMIQGTMSFSQKIDTIKIGLLKLLTIPENTEENEQRTENDNRQQGQQQGD